MNAPANFVGYETRERTALSAIRAARGDYQRDKGARGLTEQRGGRDPRVKCRSATA